MLFTTATREKKFKALAATIFVAGVTLRIVELFYNRSLFCDEGLLSVNFLNRNFSELLKPLDNLQVAPILFLWMEKLMMNIFGQHDFSLRIMPLIISLLSLYLFFKVTIQILGKGVASLIILFMFSTSMYMLRYALEVKQYQGDMMVALFFLWQLLTYSRFNSNNIIIRLLIAGCAAIWFSNVAVVVLFSSGLYILFVEYAVLKKIPLKWIFVFLLWAASFGCYFIFFIWHHPAEQGMLEYWNKQFPPYNIFSYRFILWLKSVYLNITWDIIPVTSVYNVYAIFFLPLLAAGIYQLSKKNKKAVYLLSAPIIFHFLLSYFRRYPFMDRLAIYLFPSFYIMSGAGLQAFSSFMRRYHFVNAALIKYVLILPLLILSMYDLYNLYPCKVEEIKESISFIKQKIQPDQKIYVYHACRVVFSFYKETGIADFTNKILIGKNHRDNIENYKDDFTNVNGDVWLLFAHSRKKEVDFIVNYLKSRGTLKETFSTTGSDCFLFSIYSH